MASSSKQMGIDAAHVQASQKLITQSMHELAQTSALIERSLSAIDRSHKALEHLASELETLPFEFRPKDMRSNNGK